MKVVPIYKAVEPNKKGWKTREWWHYPNSSAMNRLKTAYIRESKFFIANQIYEQFKRTCLN